MTRRATLSERMWPDTPDAAELATQWARGITNQILDLTWRGFDALRAKHLSRVDLAQLREVEQPERDLVDLHFGEILLLWKIETDGFVSFLPHHEKPEMASRSSAQAKPPAYDLAFVSIDNRRWIWPMEAKVLHSPNALAEYLKDVNEKFVGGIASPLIGEGGMIGYLFGGGEETVFGNLEERLDQRLKRPSDFADRPHGISRHSRAKAPELRLHHMIMICVDL